MINKILSNKSNIIFTAYGRNGIFMFLKNISHSLNDIILVPSYVCGEEAQAILNSGFSIKPYHIKIKKLEININDIKNKLNKNKNIKGILITHFFGFPQNNIEKLKIIAKNKNIFIIEDCAHCLESRTENGKELGSFGDVSIFSLRKFLSIPHGGVVIINNKLFKNVGNFNKMPSEAISVEKKIYRKIKNGKIKPGTTIYDIYKSLKIQIKKYGPRLEKWGGYSLGISSFAANKIKKTNFQKLIIYRKNIYKKYVAFFKQYKFISIEPVFSEYYSFVTPLFFPIIYKGKNIKKIREKLKENKSVIRPFWEHDYKMINKKLFPEVKFLKNNLIILPIINNTKKIFDIINKVFE
ncbi:MAG: DegT/DnrJ/EryC1/StrS family aminotransferase [Candidatus Paceibacterota bacterium]